MSKLTDTQIKQAKPAAKTYPMADGGGLRLMVQPSGVKTWLFNYYRPFTKARNNLTIGQYPAVKLAQAREKRAEFKALLAQGIDPAQQREQDKQAQADNLALTFEKMAWQWFDSRRHQANFSERTAKDTKALFDRHIIPLFGKHPIGAITPLFAIETLKPFERAGKPAPQGMKTITPEELAEFIAALYAARDNSRFRLNAFYAVLLTLLTSSRPSEIAKAKWQDVDLNDRLWRYRVQKGNKNLPQGRLHAVTLSTQAVRLFEKIAEYNQAMRLENSPYVFPSLEAKEGHLVIETIRQAIIRAIGKGRLTTHGIRHLFSTSMNEKGEYKAEWIEQALSHRDRNTIRQTYNKAQYLEQRLEMLQAWGDHIESLAPKPFL